AAPAPKSPEELLCRQFIDWKNSHDPRADDLLGPAPIVPKDPVSPQEADRLHAEIFLRRDYRVLDVHPESGETGRIVLVLEGNLQSERIPIPSPTPPDYSSCAVVNPDLVVEVRRDNKIYAVRAQVHDEGSQKLSRRNQQKLREAFGLPPE